MSYVHELEAPALCVLPDCQPLACATSSPSHIYRLDAAAGTEQLPARVQRHSYLGPRPCSLVTDDAESDDIQTNYSSLCSRSYVVGLINAYTQLHVSSVCIIKYCMHAVVDSMGMTGCMPCTSLAYVWCRVGIIL